MHGMERLFVKMGTKLDVIEQAFSPNTLQSCLAEFISTFIFVFFGVGSAISAGETFFFSLIWDFLVWLVGHTARVSCCWWASLCVGKMTSDVASDETILVAVAMGHAFALFVAVYTAANLSGGHVNPAITFGLMLGGHVSILHGIFYWMAQLLGSTMACLLLMLVTAGQVSQMLNPLMLPMVKYLMAHL